MGTRYQRPVNLTNKEFSDKLFFFIQVELNHLNRAYKAVCDQMITIFSQRLWYIMLEQFLMKYVWSGTGMIMVSIPIIFGKKGLKSINYKTWRFFT